jgi:hypothetical protein
MQRVSEFAVLVNGLLYEIARNHKSRTTPSATNPKRESQDSLKTILGTAADFVLRIFLELGPCFRVFGVFQ